MKKLLTTGYSDTSFSIALLLIRIAAGLFMFFNHGIPKLMDFREKSGNFYDPFHIGSQWSLSLVIFAEVFCSLLLVLGLFTRLAVAPLLATMVVVIFMAKKAEPIATQELALLFLAIFMGVLLVGPGKYSIDKAMGY
jgi:putative oxidoreductase